MQVTANGLVIHERVLSNDNRLLTILTAEYGIVRAFVKLVKKLGGPPTCLLILPLCCFTTKISTASTVPKQTGFSIISGMIWR